MSVHVVIHAATVAAAGVGAGLAPIPGSDAPVLVGIQTAMIMALAEELGAPMKKAAAAELVLTLGATMAGRHASAALLGWIPGFGSLINASTAASLTEAVGWAAVAWLEERALGGRGLARP